MKIVMPEKEPRQLPEVFVLDEVDAFVARFVHCTEQQRHAMVLYAAATHAIRACATFPRLLFTSEEEESGKTLAMNVTVALSSRPVNAAGTTYDLTSALAEAHNEPERPVPTVYRDEISGVFGRSGYGGGNGNVIADVLREGYKRGATRGRARNGVSDRYSIFTPFVMTGLRTSVPRDIRSRCIVVQMVHGSPREYFDVRDAESDARDLGAGLAQEVSRCMTEIREFRARNLCIPRLRDRKAEVWEPLFAVAVALGGSKWLTRCTAAFRALALAELTEPVLTPRQKLLQLLAEELAPPLAFFGFVPGTALSDELRRLPRYEGNSQGSASNLIAAAMPVDTEQRRLPSGQRVRGYYLQDILDAWESVRPVSPDEMELPEEEDPFAVSDDDDDEDIPLLGEPESGEGTAGTAGTAQTAPMPAVPAKASSQAVLKAVESSNERGKRVSARSPAIRKPAVTSLNT